MKKIAKVCHVLGFASIALSAYCYNAYGIAVRPMLVFGFLRSFS